MPQRILALLALGALLGCVDPGSTLSSNKTLTAFSFATPAVSGSIDATNHTIALTVPSGTDVTALVAQFTTTGAKVRVGATTQVSGTTAQDFTSDVTYTVVAEDGSSLDYVVHVTVALSSQNDFLSFAIASPAASGTVDTSAHTIAVTLPSGSAVNNLVATFAASAGASVSIGGTAQVSGTTANDFSGTVTYTVTAADGTPQTYAVTVSVASSSAKDFLSFTLAGATGTIDTNAHTVAVTVPFGTDRTALAATWSTSATTVKVGQTVQVSGTTTNNFTNQVTYTLIAADNSQQTYAVSTTVAPSNLKQLSTFSLSDGTSSSWSGTIDQIAHTVSVTVPSLATVTGLVGTFTVSAGATLSLVLSGSTPLQTSGTSANDYTNPVTFRVTAADGSHQDYVVTVAFANFVAGTTSATLNFNRLTGEPGRYGVYLWVEDSSGNFIKTLSYYIDWGNSSTDGTSKVQANHYWFMGASASDGGALHLSQSAAWRLKAGVTSNAGAVDATTSATLGLVNGSGLTSFSVTFGGTSPSLNNPLRSSTTTDEYFGNIMSTTGKFLGWDGKDASGTPVAAGTYHLRLTVQRKANGIATPATPLHTEYQANVVVGASSSTSSFSPVHVTVSGGTVNVTAGSASDEVVGSNGPVLASSTVTYTP